MAVAYASAGAGAAAETNGATLSLTCPAVVNAGDVLIAHVVHLGTTTAPTYPTGWTHLHGPVGLSASPTGRVWVFGKLAVGNEDGTGVSFGTAGGTNGR